MPQTAHQFRLEKSQPSAWLQGPPSIRTENAQLVDYIYVDLQGRDLGGYVPTRKRPSRVQSNCNRLSRRMERPIEYLERAKRRLQTVVPLTLFLIFLLL